jgi:hypothetical protein
VETPGSHDGSGNTPGKTFFTVVLQHLGELFLASPGQPLCGSLSGTAIHTHIQGAILQETEAAFTVVELRAGYAQVE